MAGGIGLNERAVILPSQSSLELGAALSTRTFGAHRVVHRYGSRVVILDEATAARRLTISSSRRQRFAGDGCPHHSAAGYEELEICWHGVC